MWNNISTTTISMTLVLALLGCDQIVKGTDGKGNNTKAIKAPLEGMDNGALHKTSAATYYTFGIGSGLTNVDLNQALLPSGFMNKYLVGGIWKPVIPSPGGTFIEATYSSRLAGTPENMWVSNAGWLQSGTVLDNEQIEQHYNIINAAPYTGSPSSRAWAISFDYAINTEADFDYFWVNSTGLFPACNSPGIVREKISGLNKTGRISFTIEKGCSNPWLGLYYIKDGSVTVANEYVRIKNLSISTTGPL
jgi:hypothetical protein